MGRKAFLVITFWRFIGQDLRPLPPYTPEKGPEIMIGGRIQVSVTPMNRKIMLGGGHLMAWSVEERVAYPYRHKKTGW